MKVILIKDVDNLGGKDELVNVKNGYARNFLFPTKCAVEATESNTKQLDERLKVKAKKEAAMLAEITIQDDIKETGSYKATIDFGNGQNTEIDIEIGAEA
jgi:large subunit ribosomal protein L9